MGGGGGGGGGIFRFFFSKICFLTRTLDSNEEIHTGLLNRTGAPEASVFPIHKMAELPNYGLFQRAFLSISKLTNQSLVFTCYGVVKLFFFSILKHIIIFYKQKICSIVHKAFRFSYNSSK